MSLTNPNTPVSQQDLQDFYHKILPYLGRIVTSKAGFTPIGTIISVMGVTAPANYLACDGTVYYITDYEDLANYFEEQFGSKNVFGGDGIDTFAVPDLRGEFLRGTGTNSHSGQGDGASVGAHQDATEMPYQGTNGSSGISYFTEFTTGGQSLTRNADTTDEVSTKYRLISGTAKSDGSSQSIVKVRPTNTSVLYCIATKNFLDTALDYTTDERVVGTWIDGKPIYQRTVSVGTITLGTTKTIDYNDWNLSEMINVFGCGMLYYNNANQGRVILPAKSSSGSYVYEVSMKSTMANTGLAIYSEGGKSSSSIIDVYITIQYTKTTD